MGVESQHSRRQEIIIIMLVKTFASLLALACASQAAPQFQGDSSLAKILQEQRFNAGGGKFGSAFAQEDGVVFREESSGNNNRIGQYSYIGVDGFRILGGDHIPSGGQNSAAAETTNDDGTPYVYDYEYYDDAIPTSPFVNPHDPSHQQRFLIDGNLAGHLAQRTFTTPRPSLPGQPTIEPAHRFFPPGQIKLDRFPEGFNFNFKSSK